jgi:hypothetical protein
MRVRPVKPEWILGVARGELPGLGIQTLSMEDSDINNRVPSNTWSMFYLTLALIIVIFFVTPISLYIVEIWVRKKRLRLAGEEYQQEYKVNDAEGTMRQEENLENQLPPPPGELKE